MAMLRTGDLNLNYFGQAFGDSVKEGVRQAMLQHETIFRNQVRELHRLYWTQKNLMNELYRREAHHAYHASSSRMAEGFLMPSHSPVGVSMLGGNVGLSEEFKEKFIDTLRKPQRSFSTQLPADECVRNDGTRQVDKRLKMKGVLGDEIVNVTEMVRHTREATDEKDGVERSLLNGENSLYCYEVIDLEEYPDMEPHDKDNGSSYSSFKAPIDKRAGLHASVPTTPPNMVLPSRRQSDIHVALPVVNLHSGHCERWHEQKLLHPGTELSESCATGFVDLSSNSTQIGQSPSKPMLIDLNIAHDDEPCRASNDPVSVFPSPSSSSTVIQHEAVLVEPGTKGPKGLSVALKPEVTCPATMISSEKGCSRLFPGCQDLQSANATEIDLNRGFEANDNIQGSGTKSPVGWDRNSLELFSSGSSGGIPNSLHGAALLSASLCKQVEEKQHSITCSDSVMRDSVVTSINNIVDNIPLHSSAGSTNLPPRVTEDLEGNQADHEGSEEDTVSSHAIGQDEKQEDGPVEIFSTWTKSDHITGNGDCSSQEKSVGDSGTTTQLDSPAAESLPNNQAPATDPGGPVFVKEQACNTGRSNPWKHTQDQATEIDFMIINAAEAIMQISLTKPASPVEQFSTAGPSNSEDEEDSSNQPQCSSDTFELMTLELPDLRNDEHLMPARQTDKEPVTDQSEVKSLRRGRGRGVRDFQRDVLPGLVSLSRHEICEDLHAIGNELRKQTGPRKVCAENWFVPVRSRRSTRHYSVSRRC